MNFRFVALFIAIYQKEKILHSQKEPNQLF